jgi:hypothetical protein
MLTWMSLLRRKACRTLVVHFEENLQKPSTLLGTRRLKKTFKNAARLEFMCPGVARGHGFFNQSFVCDRGTLHRELSVESS